MRPQPSHTIFQFTRLCTKTCHTSVVQCRPVQGAQGLRFSEAMNAIRTAAVVPGFRAVFHSSAATRHSSLCSNLLSPLRPCSAASLGQLRATVSSKGFEGRIRLQQVRWIAADGAPAVATESSPAAAELQEEDPKLVEGVDIRVGKVLKAWKHPEADSLYVEEVDVGEETGPRTICSGLVKYVPLEELQDRTVLVLANLKPRNMRGVKSNGMLLAASDAAHENVELLVVPEGAAPGERVWFGAEADGAAQGEGLTPNQLQKKKVWEAVQPQLRTDEDGVAMFKDRPMRLGAGVVKSKSLKGGNIS